MKSGRGRGVVTHLKRETGQRFREGQHSDTPHSADDPVGLMRNLLCRWGSVDGVRVRKYQPILVNSPLF